MSIKADLSLKQ